MSDLIIAAIQVIKIFCGIVLYIHSAEVESGWEEIPHVQGQEWCLHFAGPAVWRYPISKVRETQVRW